MIDGVMDLSLYAYRGLALACYSSTCGLQKGSLQPVHLLVCMHGTHLCTTSWGQASAVVSTWDAQRPDESIRLTGLRMYDEGC